MSELQIIDLGVQTAGRQVLSGLNLSVKSGEVHVLMGPNGAGKTTFAKALLGHYSYTVTSGRILIDGEDLTDLATFARARAGLTLLLQEPPEIPGVTVEDILRTAVAGSLSYGKDNSYLPSKIASLADSLGIGSALLERGVNMGASGGEKKRLEALQLCSLSPKFGVLDELDSGLDVDALKKVSMAVKDLVDRKSQSGEDGEGMGVIIVTHYNRVLEYLPADKVHLLVDGTIVETGDASLVAKVEEYGYGPWLG
ncbi:MAG: Fe-S cluster assembly ATPase SufC [Firmicutes bacterium]|jgi:Fe-S cluster assembly ATP-binding protein|nr:Fe-S cluster assembly ATPase SufC [Bacillota bacterium]